MLKEQPMKQVILQSATFLLGGITESTLNHTRTPGFKMVRSQADQGLIITHRDEQIFIPDTNVKVYYLDKNDK